VDVKRQLIHLGDESVLQTRFIHNSYYDDDTGSSFLNRCSFLAGGNDVERIFNCW
jgi:hypothetical protein